MQHAECLPAPPQPTLDRGDTCHLWSKVSSTPGAGPGHRRVTGPELVHDLLLYSPSAATLPGPYDREHAAADHFPKPSLVGGPPGRRSTRSGPPRRWRKVVTSVGMPSPVTSSPRSPFTRRVRRSPSGTCRTARGGAGRPSPRRRSPAAPHRRPCRRRRPVCGDIGVQQLGQVSSRSPVAHALMNSSATCRWRAAAPGPAAPRRPRSGVRERRAGAPPPFRRRVSGRLR